jgi:hypothetical protein
VRLFEALTTPVIPCRRYTGKYIISQTGCQWLTPVILATEEAEIRRIMVQSQPRQIVSETLSQKYPTQGLTVAQGVECLSSKYEALKKKTQQTSQGQMSENESVGTLKRNPAWRSVYVCVWEGDQGGFPRGVRPQRKGRT